MRELRVSDTDAISPIHRTSYFTKGEGSGIATGVQIAAIEQASGVPRKSQADSDTSDAEWVGCYDDFDGMSFSGTTLHCSSDEFCHEDAQKELGHYNKGEDPSHWTFEERFADDQWNEPNLTLQ